MHKEVQMSIKAERDLRDMFAEVAAREHRSVSQMIREYMWASVEGTKVPNAETRAAMEEVRNGGGKRFDNVSDLFHDLGIS
jgi:hypothetical protein